MAGVHAELVLLYEQHIKERRGTLAVLSLHIM